MCEPSMYDAQVIRRVLGLADPLPDVSRLVAETRLTQEKTEAEPER